MLADQSLSDASLSSVSSLCSCSSSEASVELKLPSRRQSWEARNHEQGRSKVKDLDKRVRGPVEVDKVKESEVLVDISFLVSRLS